MVAWAGILGSVAASAVFFFIEPHLLSLPEPWRLIGTAIVFLVFAGLAFYFSRKEPTEEMSDGLFLSDNEIGQGLKAKIDRTDVSRSSGGKVLSDNKVGGRVDIDIKDSQL